MVAQDAPEVCRYDRAAGFREERLLGPEASLVLPSLHVTVPLSEIYRNTGLV